MKLNSCHIYNETTNRKTAPWYHQIKAPIRAANIGGLFVLERWILPTFTEWGDELGIHDQFSFSDKCGDLGTCDDLKVWRKSREERGSGNERG